MEWHTVRDTPMAQSYLRSIRYDGRRPDDRFPFTVGSAVIHQITNQGSLQAPLPESNPPVPSEHKPARATIRKQSAS